MKKGDTHTHTHTHTSPYKHMHTKSNFAKDPMCDTTQKEIQDFLGHPHPPQMWDLCGKYAWFKFYFSCVL